MCVYVWGWLFFFFFLLRPFPPEQQPMRQPPAVASGQPGGERQLSAARSLLKRSEDPPRAVPGCCRAGSPHALAPAPPPMQPPEPRGPPGLEGLLAAGGFAGGQGRGLLPPPPPALGGPSPPPGMNPGYPAEGPAEPPKPCPAAPPPPPAAPPGPTASTPLPYGYFGSGYYSCRVSRSALKAGPAQGPFPADKYLDPPAGGEDFQSRPAEFAFYPGYGAPYQPVAGYLDVSVVPGLGGPGEARHETLLPVDSYHQPWALGGGWSSQMCCPKEQSQAGYLLKSAFAGKVSGPGGWAGRRVCVCASCEGVDRDFKKICSGAAIAIQLHSFVR